MTSIAESPLRHTAFLAVQLTAKPTTPPPPRALMSVANQPSPDVVTSPLARLAGGVAELIPPPRAVSAVPLDTDRGEWRCFVEHLQQRGDVPGARCDDPDRGVVSPRNISVRQMLAFLRPSSSAAASGVGKPASPPLPALIAPPSDGGRADEPISEAPVDAPPEPVTVLRMEFPPEMQEIEFDVEESALDEELRQWAEIYRTKDQPSPASHEEDEPHQCFGNMPRFELAKYRAERVRQANAALWEDGSEATQDAAERPRRLAFHEHEVTRVYTLDPVSDALVSSSDQVYLTKVFDGTSKPKRLPVALAPEQVTQHRAAGQRGASRRIVNVSSVEDAPRSVLKRAEADDIFVVHSIRHPDPRGASVHADFRTGETRWTDLGRDDEPAAVHVTPNQDAVHWEGDQHGGGLSDDMLAGLHRLQRLREMQQEIDERLRLNRVMTEEMEFLI